MNSNINSDTYRKLSISGTSGNFTRSVDDSASVTSKVGEENSESPHSALNRKLSPTRSKTKNVLSPSAKKSILSSIGHKFGKVKTKASQSEANTVAVKTNSVGLEDGFVVVQNCETPDANVGKLKWSAKCTPTVTDFVLLINVYK